METTTRSGMEGAASEPVKAASPPEPRGADQVQTGVAEIRPHHPNARILLIDDEPTSIKVMRKYLKQAGYNDFLDTTESTKAVDLMSEGKPDLVILDFMMPGVDGLEILRQRFSDAALRHIPVLMLTASREAEVKVQALQLGATDFLQKPVDPNELIPRVHNILAVKAHQDSLARLNAQLEMRVLEQTEALREAYDELSSLDRLKQEFLALVSHELRTPVTGILASLELLTAHVIEDEAERRHFLQLALQQVLRLRQIVGDVEQFLILTAGRIIPERQQINVRSLVEDRAQAWRSRATEKGIKLLVEPGPPFLVHTDSSVLENSMSRLVDNAIQFTERGEVRIRLRLESPWAVVEVIDTGRGLEKEEQVRILSPLVLGGNIEHHTEGRGLGLAIVRRQMQLLGGSIGIESEGKDRGSTFRLLLPLEPERSPFAV